MRCIQLFLLICPALFFLTSCATVKQTPSEPLGLQRATRDYSNAPGTLRERAELHILLGAMAAERNQPEAAAKQFLDALNEVPESAIAERATAMALAAGDKPLALKAAEKWVSLDPHEISARELVVRLAVSNNNAALAAKQCQAIIASRKERRDHGYGLVATILGEERAHVDTVMSVMDRLLSAAPNNTFAYQAGALVALNLKQGTRARKLAYHALTLDPDSARAALLFMAALLHEHQLKKADNVIGNLYRGHDTIELQTGYARLLLHQGYISHAKQVLSQTLKKNPHNPRACFLLGVIDFTKGRLEESKKRFLAVISDNQGQDSGAQYFLGRIAELRGHWRRAIAHYRKVASSEAVDAKFREAFILGHTGRLADAAEVLRRLDREKPELSARIIAAESSILLDAGHPKAALVLLNRALTAQPGEPTFLYMRALADEQLGHASTAERELAALLRKNPKNPRLLNALGYILAVHDPSQLKRARHLVARALRIMPDNPAIIDSMGWILYRQGHPNQALPLLQKAYVRSRDPQIAAHLITVLAALGDKARARKLLQNALGRDPDNPALRKARAGLNPPVGQ